jgi:hypothetical protein
MNPRNVLISPAGKTAAPATGKALWEARHGYTRVEQHELDAPAARRLERAPGRRAAVLRRAGRAGGAQPGLHADRGLGQHSRNIHRVKAALLVAPPDMERDDVREMLPGWAPVPLNKLPFPAWCSRATTTPSAHPGARGSSPPPGAQELTDAGPRGHLNADSGLADWPEAHRACSSSRNCTSPAEPQPNITPRMNSQAPRAAACFLACLRMAAERLIARRARRGRAQQSQWLPGRQRQPPGTPTPTASAPGRRSTKCPA